MGTSSLAIDVAGGRKLGFDPQKDLVAVALVADTNNVVVVPADSPIRTIADLIAAAKAKPGGLEYGTPGIGSPAHLFSELFAQTRQGHDAARAVQPQSRDERSHRAAAWR